MRTAFFVVSFILLTLITAGAYLWLPTLLALVFIGPLILLGDVLPSSYAETWHAARAESF